MSKKLHACKTCGQMIAKNAKCCPHCGAKNKKKHLVLLILLVIIVVAIVSCVANDKDTKKDITTDIPTQAQIEYDLPETTLVVEDAPDDVIENEEVLVTEEMPEKETDALVDGMRPEFKEAMDSYEDFFEEYCDILEKYQENPTDIGLLADYTEFMAQYAETMSEMEALDDGSLNDAELKYYVDVTGRISKMLIDVAQ